MPTSDLPRSVAPTKAGTEAERARQTAIGLLSHRLNGGLNNAVMAFELALGPSGSAASMLKGGLAGAERASRAANLMDVLVSASAPVKLETSEYLADVLELLQEHASRSGCALVVAPEQLSFAGASSTAEDAVRTLVAGLAAIARGGRGPLSLHFVQRDDGAGFEVLAAKASGSR